MVDYESLLKDPAPGTSDSPLWDKLLYQAAIYPDRKTAETLLRRLWTIRSAGTIIRWTHHEMKMIPLIHPNGAWDSEADWEEVREKYLKPYAGPLKEIFSKLEA